MGQIVTTNRKHITTIPITTEQYLQEQFRKNTVDMLDNILKDIEKETQPDVTHPQYIQIEEGPPVNIMSDTAKGY